MTSSEHNLMSSTPARPDGWPRITESSPVRDLGPANMDYERCAALHNDLLTRAVEGGGGKMPPKPHTWWEAMAPSEEITKTIHPSLIEFLKCAWSEDMLPFHTVLFLYVGALKSPDGLRDRVYLYEDEDEEGRFLKLYNSSHFRLGDDEGILFDQKTLKASFIEDYNDSQEITSNEWGWMPLEVILDSYLQMIDEGKVQTVSKEQGELLYRTPGCGCSVVDQWVIYHYTKTDLERAITAFKRLVEAIESRLPYRHESTAILNLPWHDPSTLSNNALLPTDSFAYKFLKAISDCKFRFQYIAPGVRFPTVPEFQDQPITDFVTSRYGQHGQYPGDCPLRIFQIENPEHHTQPGPYNKAFGIDDIAAGFYIHPVMQTWPRFWTNGCQLVLPFGIGRSGWARKSNGEPFGVGSLDRLDGNPTPSNEHEGLYQAGFTNGITNDHLVQIDKVLNNWADRVESGDWEVNEDGVTGGINKFREADTEAHWQKYWIPPSW